MSKNPKPPEPARNKLQYRSAIVERSAVDEESRTVELSFSSEIEVERRFGIEILDHGPEAMMLERIGSGASPLLINHDALELPVGVIEEVTVGADRKGRALARFGKSARAQEIFQDVIDGIIRNVSVGYLAHEMEKIETRNGVSVYRVTRWEPYEVSLVSVPADIGVGVGRSNDMSPDETPAEEVVPQQDGDSFHKEENETPKEVIAMTEETKEVPAVDVEVVRDRERTRMAEIYALGNQHGCMDKAQEFAKDKDKNPDHLRAWILDHKASKAIQTADQNTIPDKDMKRYSVMNLIQALADRDFSKAGFEREVSEELTRTLGRGPKQGGILIPTQALMTRDLNKGTSSSDPGFTLVGTDHRADLFITLLRNRSTVAAAGATILSGLRGEVSIPRQSSASTAYWVTEGNTVTESNPGFDSVTLTPKTVGAFVDITRRMTLQSSPDVENLVRSDLFNTVGTAIDLAALHGTGANGQPTGVITAVSGTAGRRVDTGSNLLTYQDFLGFPSGVSADNADVANMAYIFTPEVVAKAMGLAKFTNGGEPIHIGGISGGNIAGYKVFVTNQLSKTISGADHAGAFGNWADLLIGEWGAMEVLVDPYTGIASGAIRVRVLSDVDVALRHAQSFVVSRDLDPAATS